MSTEQDATTAGATTGRGRLPRSVRRAQLLKAAETVFVASGYHQAAMDDIAERAGVSKPVLYQHFPSKLELYLALLDTQADHLVQMIQTAMSKTTDNKLRVFAAVEAYFDFVDADGEAFRLVFESDLRSEKQVRDRVDAMSRACVDAIAETIAADTDLDDARSHLLSIALTGISEASARGWLERREDVPKDEAIALIASLLWRGISNFPLH